LIEFKLIKIKNRSSNKLLPRMRAKEPNIVGFIKVPSLSGKEPNIESPKFEEKKAK
jgi:hypothetical protein|tara:strand:+ start:385 stop:552 length:168 start_codon:yes stop_codon:yes gene_type:complete